MGRIGGGDSALFYRMKSDHSVIYSGLSGTGAATTNTDNALWLGGEAVDAAEEQIIVQTDLTYDDNGVLTAKVNQTKGDGDFSDFLDAVAPKKASSGSTKTEELVAEDGKKKIGGSVRDAIDVLGIFHGAPDENDIVDVEIAIGNVKKTSGGRQWVAGKFVQSAFEFVSIASVTTLSIPAGLFDDGLVTPAGAQELAIDYYCKSLKLPAVV